MRQSFSNHSCISVMLSLGSRPFSSKNCPVPPSPKLLLVVLSSVHGSAAAAAGGPSRVLCVAEAEHMRTHANRCRIATPFSRQRWLAQLQCCFAATVIRSLPGTDESLANCNIMPFDSPQTALRCSLLTCSLHTAEQQQQHDCNCSGCPAWPRALSKTPHSTKHSHSLLSMAR